MISEQLSKWQPEGQCNPNKAPATPNQFSQDWQEKTIKLGKMTGRGQPQPYEKINANNALR